MNLPEAPAARAAQLGKLSQQFEQSHDFSLGNTKFWRRSSGAILESLGITEITNTDYSGVITRALKTLEAQQVAGREGVTPGLMNAILAIETEYNPDPPKWLQRHMPETFGVESDKPMNVKFSAWEDVLSDYTSTHELKPFTRERIRSDPSANIQAAAIILAHVNERIDPELKGQDRIAAIASVYAAGEKYAVKIGRPIMYGGKIATYMQEYSPQDIARTVHGSKKWEYMPDISRVDREISALISNSSLGGSHFTFTPGAHRPTEAVKSR